MMLPEFRAAALHFGLIRLRLSQPFRFGKDSRSPFSPRLFPHSQSSQTTSLCRKVGEWRLGKAGDLG
jgi:hypothetical protein